MGYRIFTSSVNRVCIRSGNENPKADSLHVSIKSDRPARKHLYIPVRSISQYSRRQSLQSSPSYQCNEVLKSEIMAMTINIKNIARTIKPPRAYRELGSVDNPRLISDCPVPVVTSTGTDLAVIARRPRILLERPCPRASCE